MIIKKYDPEMMDNCGVLRFPSSTNEITDMAFFGRDYIKELDLSKIETKKLVIGKRAFFGCEKLTKIILPTECELIIHAGRRCFANTNLKVVIKGRISRTVLESNRELISDIYSRDGFVMVCTNPSYSNDKYYNRKIMKNIDEYEDETFCDDIFAVGCR
jgi:diphthamide synthase subunit DPH2